MHRTRDSTMSVVWHKSTKKLLRNLLEEAKESEVYAKTYDLSRISFQSDSKTLNMKVSDYSREASGLPSRIEGYLKTSKWRQDLCDRLNKGKPPKSLLNFAYGSSDAYNTKEWERPFLVDNEILL